MIFVAVDSHDAGQRVLVSELLPGELDDGTPLDPIVADQIVCGFDTAEVPVEISPELFEALVLERRALGRILDAGDVLRVARTKDGHDVDG